MLIPHGELQATEFFELPDYMLSSFPFYADFACDVLGMNKHNSFANPRRFLDGINALWEDQCGTQCQQFEKTNDGWKIIKAAEITGEQKIKRSCVEWAEDGCPWSKQAAAWVLARSKRHNRHELTKTWDAMDFNQSAYGAYINCEAPFAVNFDLMSEIKRMAIQYLENDMDDRLWLESNQDEIKDVSIPVINIYSENYGAMFPSFCVPDVRSNRPEDQLIVAVAKLLVTRSPLFDCVYQSNYVMKAELVASDFDPDWFSSQEEADRVWAGLMLVTENVSPVMDVAEVAPKHLSPEGISQENLNAAMQLIKNVKLHLKLLTMNDCGVFYAGLISGAIAEQYECDLNLSGFILDTPEMINAAGLCESICRSEQEERFIPMGIKRPFQLTALVYSANEIVTCMKKLNFQSQSR